MSNARTIIEAESPRKALQRAERGIEQEMRFRDVPEHAVYFNPFPNGVTGTIEKKLPGWDRLGNYGYAAWVGRINSKGEREALDYMRINKDGGCRCFPVPKARFAEAESPKGFFQRGQEKQLSNWYRRMFKRGERFALMRPFVVHPRYGLSGRWWAYRHYGTAFSSTEFSCVLQYPDQSVFFKEKMDFYPLEEVQVEVRQMLDNLIVPVEHAAANPPERAFDGDSQLAFAHQLAGVLQQNFIRARRRWAEIEGSRPGLWAF